MERENQRIMLTKKLLKESLLRLLKKKELDKISITELCREAGINRATFYRHYEIPRDILMELERDLYYDLKKNSQIPRSKEEIRQTIEQLCLYLEQNSELLRTIIRNNSDADFAAFINSIYAEMWKEFHREGILQDLNDDDMQLLTIYSAGGAYFLLRHWVLGNIQKNAHEFAEYICNLIDKTGLELLKN